MGQGLAFLQIFPRKKRSFLRPRYFFAAAPRNPVLLRCLRMVRQRFSWKILQTSDFTGSALFSDAVNEFLESDESLNKEIFREIQSGTQSYLM